MNLTELVYLPSCGTDRYHFNFLVVFDNNGRTRVLIQRSLIFIANLQSRMDTARTTELTEFGVLGQLVFVNYFFSLLRLELPHLD